MSFVYDSHTLYKPQKASANQYLLRDKTSSDARYYVKTGSYPKYPHGHP